MAVVTFLSDYGLDDEFVGICHGVIAAIEPEARVIDITHGIARYDVRAATTFADVPPGELLLHEDSYGALSLAVNRASALQALLGLEVGGRVETACER